MSRSYKHFPFVKCEKSCKKGKKWANNKVRNIIEEIPNGKAYKKYFCSWDICDYYCTCTWEKFQSSYGVGKSYYEWYRDYKRK